VVFLAGRDTGLDLVGCQIATAPDDIAVTSPLQTIVDSRVALRLPLTSVVVYLFETSDGVTLPAEPGNFFGRYIGVYDDAAPVFAVTDDDDTELRPESAQVTAITPGDGDVVEGHVDPGTTRPWNNAFAGTINTVQAKAQGSSDGCSGLA